LKLWCVVYCIFIIQFAGKRIFKTSEHLAKSCTKWLTVSYTPFALRFRPQRCRTRHISRITCVWRTQIVTNCCCVNRQIHLVSLSTYIKLLWLTDWQTYAISDWPTSDHERDFAATSLSLLQQLCTVSHAIFNMAKINIFLLGNLIMLISSDKYC